MFEIEFIKGFPMPPGVWRGYHKGKFGFWIEIEDSDKSPGQFTVEIIPGQIIVCDNERRRHVKSKDKRRLAIMSIEAGEPEPWNS